MHLNSEGVFDKSKEISVGYNVCPRHRDQFGVRWRCNKKGCACPVEWSGHNAQPPKGDRGVTMEQSKRLFEVTKILIPVGSRKSYLLYFFNEENEAMWRDLMFFSKYVHSLLPQKSLSLSISVLSNLPKMQRKIEKGEGYAVPSKGPGRTI